MLNEMIIKALPLLPKPLVHVFAKKYIAGEELKDAVRVTKEFEKKGGKTTIDVLGEFVTTKDRALHERGMSAKVIEAISENSLKTYLSIKPTSLGLGIDETFGYENVKYLGAMAKERGIRIRIDMENSPYTTQTINLYKRLTEEGFDNFGIVIQAYLRRSLDDIKSLLQYKPNVRLCKGIYVESEEIAFKGKEEIRDNYKMLLEFLFENGAFPNIATHDEPLIRFAEDYIKKNKIARDQYEFQMLLGVREDRRDMTLSRGHDVRIYVPFGVDWYGYSTRRLKENPEMAGQIFKSIFGLGN